MIFKFHEKKLGQLFCTTSAKEIINMLIAECLEQNVKIDTESKVYLIYLKMKLPIL